MDFDLLKKAVKARIEALVTQEVYKDEAEDNATYPYIIIKYPSSSNPFLWKQDWIIELDFWDNTSDDEVITSMSNTVKEGFNGYWQSSTGIAFRTYLDFEGEFPTDIPNMSRINQRYLCPSF